jgi:hypothetical protein
MAACSCPSCGRAGALMLVHVNLSEALWMCRACPYPLHVVERVDELFVRTCVDQAGICGDSARADATAAAAVVQDDGGIDEDELVLAASAGASQPTTTAPSPEQSAESPTAGPRLESSPRFGGLFINEYIGDGSEDDPMAWLRAAASASTDGGPLWTMLADVR